MRAITKDTMTVWDFFKSHPWEEFTAAEAARRLNMTSKDIHARTRVIIGKDPRMHYMKEMGSHYRFMYHGRQPKPPAPEPLPALEPVPGSEEPIHVLANLVREQNKLLAALVSKL